MHSKNLLLPTEVFLAQADGTFWVHRRGAYRVTRPLADMTRRRDGIPFLAPEIVLLFKARSTADRDQRDVETALPVLTRDSAHGSKTPSNCCHRGKRQLCRANEQAPQHCAVTADPSSCMNNE